jgi:carboxypeptidase Taq
MVNMVRPSLIRVEADEVTYPLHIMLRFEIEKMLINEGLTVSEIPDVWNRKMEEYLGIRPDNLKNGAMQDVHWSMGAIGYFPTYSLGNFYAAAIADRAAEVFPDLDDQLSGGSLTALQGWLHEKIYSVGRRHDAEDFIEKITGKKLSIRPFMDYLNRKYTDVYELKAPSG